MNATPVEISWNGKAPAESDEGKTTTSLDKPFVISKLDLSILNDSLGTQFRPMVWIAIPQN